MRTGQASATGTATATGTACTRDVGYDRHGARGRDACANKRGKQKGGRGGRRARKGAQKGEIREKGASKGCAVGKG